MTQFQNKSFSVQMGGRKPEGCDHGWLSKGRCVFCGETVLRFKYTITAADIEALKNPRSFIEAATRALSIRVVEQFAPNLAILRTFCDIEGE